MWRLCERALQHMKLGKTTTSATTIAYSNLLHTTQCERRRFMCWIIFTISTKHLPSRTFFSFFFLVCSKHKKKPNETQFRTNTVLISNAIVFMLIAVRQSKCTSIWGPYLDWIFVSPFFTRKINRPIHWRQQCCKTFTISTEMMEWNVLILTLVGPKEQRRKRKEKDGGGEFD